MAFQGPKLQALLLIASLSAPAGAAAQAPKAAPRGPLMKKDPAAKPCTHPTNKLKGKVKLKRGCVYSKRFVIKTSDAHLDCDGAQIAPKDPDDEGVLIRGQIDNVRVENCYVDGGRGVGIKPPDRKEGESNDDYRKRSPTRIVVSNMHVTKSSNVGVYIHHHVTGATVQNCIIEENWKPGMYLGAESARNTIRNNLIRKNGFRSESGGYTIGWYRREGIAVDASAGNVIEGNQIEDNAFGGVLLYKNCWEYAAEKPSSKQRIQHSHSNIIRGNTFADQEFGVWVAARQARNLMFMKCGDPTPYKNPIRIETVFGPKYPRFKGTFPFPYLPLVSIWPDYAENNIIEGNTFRNMYKAGIRIEDDGTKVRKNLFVGGFEYIYLGSPFRAVLLNKPVDRTSIIDNSHTAPLPQTFADQLALVPGEHSNTTLKNNLRACKLFDGSLIHNGQSATLPGSAADASAGKQRFLCRDGALVCQGTGCPVPDAGAKGRDAARKAGVAEASGCRLAPGDGPTGLPVTVTLALLALGWRRARRRP